MLQIAERFGTFTRRRRTAAVAAAFVLGALIAAAPAPAAFPGANGRIAFQGYRSLASINAVGGDRRPLTNEDAAFATPAFSADGQRIAFATNRDGGDFEIYVIGADGGPMTPLTANAAEDGGPAWSPDGRRIAFESDRDGNPEIYVMNADGSGVVRLTSSILDEHSPSWSPDGSRIAFARGTPGAATAAIWTMTPDGGSLTQLTNGAANDDNPDWSPNAATIAFQRDSAIFVMAADGGGQAPLPLPGGSARPAWSPDGTRIAFDLNLELYGRQRGRQRGEPAHQRRVEHLGGPGRDVAAHPRTGGRNSATNAGRAGTGDRSIARR